MMTKILPAKQTLFILLFLLTRSVISISQDNYKQAWESLNKNDRAKAANLLESAMKDPAHANDAFVANMYLNYYNGKDDAADFQKNFYDKVTNPYPYVYALWFNEDVAGSYGKKQQSNQLKLLDRIIEDNKAPGTLVAAAHYQKQMHFLCSNQLDASAKECKEIGNIRNWQYVGPFENLSGSGFYKDYGPLEHPEPGAVFTSSNNAPIKWFKPASENTDGWNPICYQVNKHTAVVYAQTFINSASDQDVYLNAGVSGALKVWVNDELLISEYKERTTEFDTYTVLAHLKKGMNRMLVQVSYTDNSYAFFGIRLTDASYRAIPGLTGSDTYSAYPKVNAATAAKPILPHFAEAFFQKKIEEQPDNIVNYLLLADVYKRNKKNIEARRVLEKAIEKAPGNNILRVKFIEILIAEGNRSRLLEEVEKLKKSDPQSLLALELNISDHIENEKYDNALEDITKREKLYGEDETTLDYRMQILGKQDKYEDLIKLVEGGFKKYPENEKLLSVMYEIKKLVYKDNKAAMKLYEDYMKETFKYSVSTKYAKLLEEQGQVDKSLKIKMKFLKDFPYDPSGFDVIASQYYSTKDYGKAEEYVRNALSLSPYNEAYWEKLGDILTEAKKTQDAIDAYNKSLLYDPNQYEVINKVRKLKGKGESYKLLPEPDIDAIIANDKPEEAKNTDYGYYYVHDGKNTIVHPGGATESYYLLVIRITNQRGIDEYKESSISYDSRQSLLIEKAEIVKKSGTRIQGERNDNSIVFTNLEAGDVIVYKYRIQDYYYGRFAKEFTDKYSFSGQIYTAISSYNLLIPANQEIKYLVTNTTDGFKPVISNVEDFKQYSWTVAKQEPLKDEPLSPHNGDIGNVLHLSTINEWQAIATWYADILKNKTEEEYEITAVFNQLFPKSVAGISQFQVARKIYDYIEKNIAYSSVSFRQGAFVPQRASVTLNTRLGDCKDLSNLFVTLCRMANIDCKMVLVDTRDNGATDMILPSIEFNHCIAKARLDNKDYFIELTDNKLPFASLPNNLNDALILEIPNKNSTEKSTLTHLNSKTRTKDVVRRVLNIRPQGSDLIVESSCTKYGSLSSGTRWQYGELDNSKQLLEMEKSIAGSYKNHIKVENVVFNKLDELGDSINYKYTCRVKEEVAEIGSLQTFRITYPDVVATVNNFSSDEREYPVEYIKFEDADAYETIVNIKAPAGKKIVELPADVSLKFGNMEFSIKYKLIDPSHLYVVRKFTSDRKVIPAKDYAEFKLFFEKIIKAEQKMIAYK